MQMVQINVLHEVFDALNQPFFARGSLQHPSSPSGPIAQVAAVIRDAVVM
jgi:hypothetical protein